MSSAHCYKLIETRCFENDWIDFNADWHKWFTVRTCHRQL